METVFVIVAYGVGFAVVCSFIASSKNRSGASWFILGLVFGIFALVAVAFASPAPDSSNLELVAATKSCPNCGEDVRRAAKVCRYCQYSFPVAETEDWGAWTITNSHFAGLGRGTEVTLLTDGVDFVVEVSPENSFGFPLGTVQAMGQGDGTRLRLKTAYGDVLDFHATDDAGDAYDLATVVNGAR